MYDAARAPLIFFQLIHRGGVFWNRDDAKKAKAACDVFCSAYSFLAAEFVKLQLPRYHVEPALHAFKHASIRLKKQLDSGAKFIMTPSVHLCEASEDFIGQVARTARRVSAKTCGRRTLDRFLIKAHLAWSAM